MPIKAIFAIVSSIFQLAIFVPYYINIFKKKANPHLFSWLTWGTLTGLGFVLILKEGGGYGAWIFGLQSALCLSIAAYAIFKGEKNITRFDWVAFVSAIIITIFYILTKNTVLSVIFAAAIDGLGFAPTYRKSYIRPHDEPALTYLFF